MREQENINELIKLKPDFIGFIFYDKSTRNVREPINVDGMVGISKVGVFVNESFKNIEEKVREYKLDMVQLHGSESYSFCANIQQIGVKVIKAFSVDNGFDFDLTNEYENQCDYFLFDTRGKSPGGNGLKFDWGILNNYKGNTKYMLSGGISSEDADDLLQLSKSDNRLLAIDINSKFEIAPALKDISKIKVFKKELGS